ncbi:hypothetical protein TNCV_1967621 [Trichonephila clavipes]|nr:hypothetical protein TNCV_1967621 [Trichonephila clavipes]
MSDDRCCKKIFLAGPVRNRHGGRLPLSWIDCVEKELNILQVINWEIVAKSRNVFKNFWRRSGLSQDCRAIEEEVEKGM